jgi:lipoyl-dependent peroxiredoxin subunit D
MSIDALIESLPSYAKDLKLNYSTLIRQNSELTPQQLWGTLVASALATRNPELTEAVLAEAASVISPHRLLMPRRQRPPSWG